MGVDWVGVAVVAALVLAGCATRQDAAADAGQSVTVTKVGHNPPASAPGDSSTSGAPQPGWSVDLALTASTDQPAATTPVEFTLTATFHDGAGVTVDPDGKAWVVRLGDDVALDPVAGGSDLPGVFVLSFPQAGPAQVTAYVRADGFVEQSVTVDLIVASSSGALAPECKRSAALAEPTVMTATDLGPGEGEPNIEVAPDGTIYVMPITPMYRSLDGGKRWLPGGALLSGAGDGDLSVSDDGRVHVLGMEPSTNSMPYQRSDDRGAAFTPPKDITFGGGSDRQWIDAGPNHMLYASWRDNDGKIETRTSFNEGLNWTELRPLGPDGLAGQIIHGSLPHSVYELVIRGTIMTLAASHDDGATWKETHVAQLDAGSVVNPVGNPAAVFPSLAVDCAGTLYAVYADLNGELPTQAAAPLGRTSVYLKVSQDDGKTWGTATQLSLPGHVALMGWGVAGGPGKLAVGWYENVNGLPAEALPDEWNVMLWESIGADQPAPVGKVAKLTALPNHLGSVCTGGSGCAVLDRSLLDFFEVTLNARGQPVAAWISSVLGTGLVGVAAQKPHVWYGGLSDGTSLS